VQQTAEAVSSAHVRRGGVRERNQLTGRVWRREAKRPMRALVVVAVRVGVERSLELPFAEGQQPVQTLIVTTQGAVAGRLA